MSWPFVCLRLDVVEGASTVNGFLLAPELLLTAKYQATYHSINAWAVELTGWHKEGNSKEVEKQ